jgi:hypothetical protein
MRLQAGAPAKNSSQESVVRIQKILGWLLDSALLLLPPSSRFVAWYFALPSS